MQLRMQQRIAWVGSREKSSRGSDSPRRPTRSGCLMLERKFSRPPAELARENFPTAGHASVSATDLKTFEREFDSPT